MRKQIFLIFFMIIISKTYSENLMNEYKCNIVFFATENVINIRLKPDNKSKVIGQLNMGEEIYVNKEKSTDDWFFCYIPKYDSMGYCLKHFFEYKPYFDEIIDDLINKNETVYKLLQNRNVKISDMNTILEKIINKYDEKKCILIVDAAYNYGCIKDSNQGLTSLIMAVRKNFEELTKYLLTKEEFRETIETYIDGFAPPLFYSLYNGNYVITKMLLDCGANPNSSTRYGWTMFESLEEALNNKMISKEKVVELQELLLLYGYNIDEQ